MQLLVHERNHEARPASLRYVSFCGSPSPNETPESSPRHRIRSNRAWANQCLACVRGFVLIVPPDSPWLKSRVSAQKVQQRLRPSLFLCCCVSSRFDLVPETLEKMNHLDWTCPSKTKAARQHPRPVQRRTDSFTGTASGLRKFRILPSTLRRVTTPNCSILRHRWFACCL